MKPKIDYLGKVSCTVSKDYWSSEKDYDKLTIVEKEGEFGTFISRKPVLAGTPLTNREFWIPFSSVKESIILDYNSFKDKYDKTLEEYKISLDDVISRLKVLEESENNIAELIEIANGALYRANSALTAVANINNKLAKPNGIATLDSTGKVPLSQLPDNIGGGNNLELGETSTTAYPGDKGKKNADAISSLTNALDSIDSYSKTTRNQLDAFKNTKGQSQGIVPLDENGKVASSYLPSYVDDVLEYNTRTAFPTTGESGKIYIALDTNKTYRWGGTTYVELSSTVALGETASTAYAGDKGKKNREDINNLKNGLDSLTNNLDEVNNKATTNTTAIEELTTEVVNTNTEVNTINGKISKLNTTIGDVRSSFNNYASAKTPIIDKVEPHIANKQNPHEVTKAQVGLGNVTNDAQVKRSEMGANDGVATLDANGKIPESQLPAGVTSSLVLGETEGTAYDGSKGANHEASFSAFNSFDVFSFTPTSGTTNSGFKVYAQKLFYDKYPSSSKYPILNKRGPYTIINIPVVDSTKTSGCGLLLNTDKKKLDSIETGANKYVLPEAGYNVLGGIKPTTKVDGNNPSLINGTEVNVVDGVADFVFERTAEYVGANYKIIREATTEKYGLMSPEDKVKLNNINVSDEYLEGTIEVLHSGNSFKLHCQRIKFSDYDNYEYYDINIPIATNSACGLLSKEDKVKLDNLSSGGSSTITEYTEAEITALLKQIRF